MVKVDSLDNLVKLSWWRLLSVLPLFIAGSLLLSGCYRAPKQFEQLPITWAEGDTEKAERVTSHLLAKTGVIKTLNQDKSSAQYFLTAALSANANGNFSKAIAYYNRSLDAIDYYLQESMLENSATLVLDDRSAAYAGSHCEQLLARLMFALSLQHAGKKLDAAALLRQHERAADLMQEQLRASAFLKTVKITPNPVVKYLLACYCEDSFDLSNAKILFQQSKELSKASFIEHDLKNLGKRKEKAWLVVVYHEGLMHEKINTYSTGALASAAALEVFMKNKALDPAWYTLTGLAVPGYRQRPLGKGPRVTLKINDQFLQAEPFFSVAETASSELSAKLPVLAARSLARQLLRQSALAIYKKSYADKSQASFIGDFLLLAANSVTRADTRSWFLLPYSISCSRVDLEPGSYTLDLSSSLELKKIKKDSDQVFRSASNFNITLRKGLNLIEVFAPATSWLVLDRAMKEPLGKQEDYL